MADVPIKTGLPYILDVDLANALDLHLASTNYTKLASDFSNYLAAIYVWNFTKSTSDPITRQAQFFADLNSNTLNLKDNSEGSVRSVSSDIAGSYKLAKLDTLLKSTEIWIRDESGKIETKIQTTGTLYHVLDLYTSTERWIASEEDGINISDILSALDSEWGVDKMEDEFLLFWREKFEKAHQRVRDEYKLLVPDEVDDAFSSLSDSIGLLSRTVESVEATSIPLFDINFESIETIPNSVPPNILDKIDTETKANILETSKKTNTLFRLNVSKILESITTPTQSHGENLTGDYLHWIRINSLIGQLNGAIAENIGITYRTLAYMQLAKNEQKTLPVKFKLVVENSIQTVDATLNRIANIGKAISSASFLKTANRNSAS